MTVLVLFYYIIISHYNTSNFLSSQLFCIATHEALILPGSTCIYVYYWNLCISGQSAEEVEDNVYDDVGPPRSPQTRNVYENVTDDIYCEVDDIPEEQAMATVQRPAIKKPIPPPKPGKGKAKKNVRLAPQEHLDRSGDMTKNRISELIN